MTFKLKVSTLLVVLIAIIMFSCGKERDDEISTQLRSETDSVSESIEVTHKEINNDTYVMLISAMKEQWSNSFITNFYNTYGDIRFHEAHIAFEGITTSPELVTIPIIKENIVEAVMVAEYLANGTYHLSILPNSIFQESLEDFHNIFGKKSRTVISFFIIHQALYNGELHQANSYLNFYNQEGFIQVREICFEDCYALLRYSIAYSNSGAIEESISSYVVCILRCSGGAGEGFNPYTGVDVGGGGNEGDGDDDNGTDGPKTGNDWEPNDDCIDIPPTTLNYVNTISGPIPCDDRPIEEIVDEIMQELCDVDPRLSVDEVKAKQNEILERKLGTKLNNKIKEARAANYINPCDPDMDVVDEAIEGMNGSSGCDEDAFDEALNAIYNEDFANLISDLKNHHCATEFSDAIDEIINISNCDLDNFSSAFRSYFGITETFDIQTTPSIGLNQNLCPNIFTITDVEDDLHVSAGISGFSFQINVTTENGIETQTITHPFIQVMFNSDISGCNDDFTQQTLLSTAFNLAIQDIRNQTINFSSYDAYNASLNTDGVTPDAFQSALNARLEEILVDCGGNGPSFNVHLSSSSNWGTLQCNTIYNQLLNTSYNVGC